MRLVFLGSPPFAAPVFRRLAESEHEVLALVTRPDKAKGRGRSVATSPLVEAAREAGTRVLQPASTREEGFEDSLRALEPDLLFVASYGEILRENILSLAPRGALNVHASLLPRHRGASPIQAAILAGDEETGVSIQRMVLALDEGDVLHERRLSIGPDETAGALLGRLAELGGEAALEALALLEGGQAEFRPQDPALATYAKRIKKEQGEVAWSTPAAKLARHVRAMSPWPGAFTSAPGGKLVTIAQGRASDEAHAAPPGSLLETGKRVVVACGEGSYELLVVKPAGKQEMEAGAWLRGARLEVGTRLGGQR